MNAPTRSLLIAALLMAPVMASAADELTSLSYISYLERYATIRPASGEESYDAVVNMPLLAGDRLETARGARLEVQLADGSTLWVDEFTTVDFDSLAYSRDTNDTRTAIFLNDDGAVAIEIPSTALGSGTLRLDTPAGTVYLSRPGLFRVTTHDGELDVQTHTGLAELPSGLGSALLRGGQQARIDDDGEIETFALAEDDDDFWAWVQERRAPQPAGATSVYVDSRASSRAYVLDSYGDWVYVPTVSSYMWRPHVPLTWVPFSSGRWVWTPVGWTWVAYEPWGWYPFHYGSWYWHVSVGWVWGYDPVWGPAWVHWMHYPGYIGWCPRGYYDWHYGHHPHGGYHAGHFPDRWRSTAFDFSGQVRLGQVDHRPWTMVPTEHFASSRIERVRIDPDRLIRGGEEGRIGFVRSGPLQTERPGRSGVERVIEPAFRSVGQGTARDLSEVFSRTADGSGVREAQLRPVRTGEMVGRVPSPDVGRPDSERGQGTTRTPVRPGPEGTEPPTSGSSPRIGSPPEATVRRGTPDTRGGTAGQVSRGGGGAVPSTRGTTRPERTTTTTAPNSRGASGSQGSTPRQQVRSSSPSDRSTTSSPPRPPSSTVKSAPPPASRSDPPKRQTMSYRDRRELVDRIARSLPENRAGRGTASANQRMVAASSGGRTLARSAPSPRSARTMQAGSAGVPPATSRGAAAPRVHASASPRQSASSGTAPSHQQRSSGSSAPRGSTRSGGSSPAPSGHSRSR